MFVIQDQLLRGERSGWAQSEFFWLLFKWDHSINKLLITKLFKELKAVHNPAYSKETIAGKLLSAIADNQKLLQAIFAINSASE